MPSQPQAQPQPPQSEPQSPERSLVATTTHGRLKLTDWVIGTLPDREAAQASASTFLSAGFTEDDVLVESPTAALQQLRQEEEAGERSVGWLARLLYAVEEAVTGADAALREVYVREAQGGRWFVGAHDAQGNQLDRIRNVLVDQGARNVRLFEPSGVRLLG